MKFAAQRPICTNCGVAYPVGDPPAVCAICEDERVTGPPIQTWITANDLARTHTCEIRCAEGEVLTGIGVVPAFGIAQRAVLVETPGGCILWDCLSLVDESAIRYIESRGGLRAIAISHPHFYGDMRGWSEAFGGVPVYVHEADAEWLTDAPANTVLWTGNVHELLPGVTLVRCGGHFEGAAVMHVASAAAGHGAVLAGDTIMVAQYGCGISAMRSYPTYLPLEAAQIQGIRDVLAPFKFAAIYGPWWDRVIRENADETVLSTLDRHLEIFNSGRRLQRV